MKRRVLVVDDTVQDLKLMTMFLSAEPHTEVATAMNGFEVLQRIETDRWDLVVMNVQIPLLDGIETVRKIRQAFSSLELPVILTTSSREYGVKVAAFEAGADDLMQKPLDRFELINRCRILISNKRLHQELEEKDRMIRSQLSLAQKVQRRIQFQGSRYSGRCSIHARYLPLDDVGGDIVHVRHFAEDRMLVFIGDVTGHGISSAMVGTIVKTLLDGLHPTQSAVEVAGILNAKLCECLMDELDFMFVTAIVCILNTRALTARIVNAGHPQPVWCGWSGGVRILQEEELRPGLPLGMFPGSQYHETQLDLAQMKEMILYTDGLFSHISEDNRENPDLIYHVIDRVHAGSAGFADTHSDDLAMVRISIHEISDNA